MMAARKKQEDGNLVRHAKLELELLGEEPEIIEGYLDVLRAFAKMSHSGGSASIAIPVINALLLFKNITPLTDDPSEWMEIDKDQWNSKNNIWQSKRNSEAFSTDGGKTYYLLSEGAHFHNQRPIHHTQHKEV